MIEEEDLRASCLDGLAEIASYLSDLQLGALLATAVDLWEHDVAPRLSVAEVEARSLLSGLATASEPCEATRQDLNRPPGARP